ncbi:MAG: GNAT family N-acetyltransferase [Verrucomicrobia bacterium]|nr:GNAT family N-acetyltransferase [Verrucomicrobiota bacterium]
MKLLDSAQDGEEVAVRIRPFRPESDVTACIEIYYWTRRETFSWVPRVRFQPSDFLADTLAEEIFVADRGGEVVAFAGLYVPDRFLHHLYVKREHQRRGVGSLLLRHVLECSGNQLRLKCLCRNKGALAFYRSQGWCEGERGRDAFGKWVLLQSPRAGAVVSPGPQVEGGGMT